MKKLCSVFILLSILSCSDKDNSKKSDVSKMQKVEYIYKDGGRDIPVEITSPPQRAALFNPYTTEILLALGLEDKIIIGSTEGELLPEFRKAYEKVPQKLKGHGFRMDKEAFLLSKPDFAAGNINAETAGSPEELMKLGISPYNLRSLGDIPNPTLNDVYDDIYLLGRIFNVEDRAKDLVNKMKKKLEVAQKDFVNPENSKKKKVLILSYRGGIAAFSALATDLVNKAHGINIYQDLHERFEFVTPESVLERNPDAIFIIDIKSRPEPVEEKMEIFRTNPVLKNTNAVKNNQIYKIDLEDVTPGVRNVDFIIRLNNILYKNGK